MKAIERDELLIRMDERLEKIREEDLPQINEHLKRLNGGVANNSKIIDKLSLTVQTHQDALNNLPWKKRWFWTVVAIIILGVFGGAGGLQIAEKLLSLIGS